MKKLIRSFSALTLCVLCIISVVMPVFAGGYCIDGTFNHTAGSISCNNAYRIIVYGGANYCYKVINERCDARCTRCGKSFFYRHEHLHVQDHNFVEELGVEVCYNLDCHWTRPIDE